MSPCSAREVARARYAELRTQAGDWLLPAFVRGPMAAWEFDTFAQREPELAEILTRRDEVDADAVDLGLAVRRDAKPVFEAATDDLDDVSSALDAQEHALEAYAEAERLVNGDRGLLSWIGLMGHDPKGDLAALRVQWEAGDDAAVTRRAEALASLVDGAVGRGTVRLVIPALLGLAAVVLLRMAGRALRPGATDPTPDDRAPDQP
ncbi:MAG: hypothetical protein R2695_06440 [Acidimicrobiales bacterium]